MTLHLRFLVNQLSLLIFLMSAIVLCVGVWSYLPFGDDPANRAGEALFLSAVIGMAMGFVSWFVTRTDQRTLTRRDALILVAMTWLVGAGVGALPYFLWTMVNHAPDDHPFRAFDACWFESMSGFTTCGATVLTDIEAMPRSILLWRSLTQWIGGLGIVVLYVAILPSVGVGGKRLFAAESSRVSTGRLQPQIRHTVRILWLMYLGLTLLQVLLLISVGRMSAFDAFCHSFTTLSTGGFSPRNASIAAYDSSVVNFIVMVFMLLGGVNFAIYYYVLRKRWSRALKDVELIVYVLMIVACSAIVIGLISGRDLTMLTGETTPASTEGSIEHALFTVISLVTTTGYATADYDLWPPLAGGLIFMLVFVGGCAGSTAGGIKVIRAWTIARLMGNEIEREYRPAVIRPVRIGPVTVTPDLRNSIMTFAATYLFVLIGCASLLMFLERDHGMDWVSAFSGTVACMSTTGPGLGLFGGVENYGWLHPSSMWLLTIAMMVGRLEVFAVLALCTARFWNPE